MDRPAALSFDPLALDPAFLVDPYPTYRALRELDPVHRNPDGSYFLTRYDDVAEAYRDRRLSTARRTTSGRQFGDGGLLRHHTLAIAYRDPPEHTRLRRRIAPLFTPAALAVSEPRIVRIVDDLLDRAAAREHFDLIDDFAFPLVLSVVCELFGVPPESRAPLRSWSAAILRGIEPTGAPRLQQVGADADRAVDEFSALLRDLLARPGPPANGLQALLADADAAPLTEDELLQNIIFLIDAGHETTTNLLGNGIHALLDHPGELERLRADPGLLRTAVDELLRFDSPAQVGNRVVAEPLTIGDVAMEPGTRLWLSVGAANRDPAQFKDPDVLDLARSPNRHVAFGGGIHACAGLALARLEAQIAIGRLLVRFPRLRRAGEPVRNGKARFRGFTSYPIAT